MGEAREQHLTAFDLGSSSLFVFVWGGGGLLLLLVLFVVLVFRLLCGAWCFLSLGCCLWSVVPCLLFVCVFVVVRQQCPLGSGLLFAVACSLLLVLCSLLLVLCCLFCVVGSLMIAL